MDSDPKAWILARRARFMALVVATSCSRNPAKPTALIAPTPSSVANPSVDSDADGVDDSVDRCPKEPGSRETSGCPDSDGDGLIDFEDACPDVRGTKEMGGCPSLKAGLCLSMLVIVPLPIDRNQTLARADNVADNAKAVRLALQSNAEITIEIRGHAAPGEPRGLALRRAEEMKRECVKQGADATRITVTERTSVRNAEACKDSRCVEFYLHYPGEPDAGK